MISSTTRRKSVTLGVSMSHSPTRWLGGPTHLTPTSLLISTRTSLAQHFPRFVGLCRTLAILPCYSLIYHLISYFRCSHSPRHIPLYLLLNVFFHKRLSSSVAMIRPTIISCGCLTLDQQKHTRNAYSALFVSYPFYLHVAVCILFTLYNCSLKCPLSTWDKNVFPRNPVHFTFIVMLSVFVLLSL